MATYTDYGYFYGTRGNTSTGISTLTDFDYQNNKLLVVCGYQSGYQATVSNSTLDSSWPPTGSQWTAGLYTCSSSSITITRSSYITYWGYYIIPNEATVTYIGESSSSVTLDLSDFDYDNNVLFITRGSSTTSSITPNVSNLTFIQNLYSASQGNCCLYRVTSGVTSLQLYGGSLVTTGPCFKIVIPKSLFEPELHTGDIIQLITPTSVNFDFTGYQFTCRLKGNSYSTYNSPLSYGANCCAEFDFRNVSDGNVTIGRSYGAYIALTNGTGTDIKYNRIMVAGDAGTPSYYGSSGNMQYDDVGGNAGLFGGNGASGSTGSNGYYAYGGGQSSGGNGAYHSDSARRGNAGSFGTGGARVYQGYSYSPYTTYYGGAGGNGWYGGGSGMASTQGTSYTTSGGGGSSYLLTAASYKPTGYFPEWTTYQPLISNGTSESLTGNRDYYAIITIIYAPSVGPVLPDPSILQRYDATNDQFDPCNIYILKKDITEFETTDLTTPVISQKPSDSSYSPEASTLTPSVGTEELKFASGTFTNTLSVVGSDYSSKTITTDTLYATFTIPLGTSKCYVQMSSSVPSPYCGYTLKVYNGSTFDTIVDNDRHTTPIDITSSISVGTTNLFEFSVSMSGSYQFDSASDYMKLVLLPETGETNTFQVCALYRYDSTNDEFVKIGG